MTTHGFQDALSVMLREEGGYSNNPEDPGGMTNLGVTARAWAQWIVRPVTEQVMRGLRQVDVGPFYKARYWDKAGCGSMPQALALVVFDFAVNAGPATAVKVLQSIVGAPKDGQFGPATRRAMQAYVTSIGLGKLITRYGEARRDYYREADGFLRFGKGWVARVDRIEKEALSWVG